jgi:hypothetical protein
MEISTTIEVNGSTWDGGGQTVRQIAGNPLYDGPQCDGCEKPFFRITSGTVKNCTMAPPIANSIFLMGGNCTVDNVIAPDIDSNFVTVKKPGTYIVSNCTANNGEDKIIQINDLCTITTQNINVKSAGRFMRQNGAKTWKMTSYCNDCTIMDISSCIFRSDSTESTFFYRNLTTNCTTIGYPAHSGDPGDAAGVKYPATNAVPY